MTDHVDLKLTHKPGHCLGCDISAAVLKWAKGAQASSIVDELSTIFAETIVRLSRPGDEVASANAAHMVLAMKLSVSIHNVQQERTSALIAASRQMDAHSTHEAGNA